MSSWDISEDVFGNLRVTFGSGKGWGGNGRKPYRCIIDFVDNENRMNPNAQYVIGTFTPEDTARLGLELLSFAYMMHSIEDSDEDMKDLEPDDRFDEQWSHIAFLMRWIHEASEAMRDEGVDVEE